MAFSEKDIYRGLVLCELTKGRNNPTRLCLIERGGLESNQVMEINAAAYLYFKYGSPIASNTDRFRYKWQFVFRPNNIEQLEQLVISSEKGFGLALVCSNEPMVAQDIKIAFIRPEKLDDFLDLKNKSQQIIYVYQTNHNKIEVDERCKDRRYRISQTALRDWNP